jgi:hypothetical protein
MAILRGLSSRLLNCGCLVGVYETYARKSVSIIDARGAECHDESHRVDAEIEDVHEAAHSTGPTNSLSSPRSNDPRHHGPDVNAH